MPTDQAIESEIQAKGLTAPRVTQQTIEDSIRAYYTFTAWQAVGEGVPKLDELKLLTIAVLVLKNGFTVTGESACASPENYDAELAADRIEALESALSKIYAKASRCDPSHYNQTMTEIIDIACSVSETSSKQQSLSAEERAIVEQYLADVICPACDRPKWNHRPGCSEAKMEGKT